MRASKREKNVSRRCSTFLSMASNCSVIRCWRSSTLESNSRTALLAPLDNGFGMAIGGGVLALIPIC